MDKVTLVLLHPEKGKGEKGKALLQELSRGEVLVRLVPCRQWRQKESRVRLLVTKSFHQKLNRRFQQVQMDDAQFVGAWELGKGSPLEPRRLRVQMEPQKSFEIVAMIDTRDQPVRVYRGIYAPLTIEPQQPGVMDSPVDSSKPAWEEASPLAWDIARHRWWWPR